MAWEPWLDGRKKAEDREPLNPNDLRHPVNASPKEMTEEERKRTRQWVHDLIFDGRPLK